MGSCSPVSWSRWVQTSRAEKPSRRMQEFVFAVASAKVTSDTGPPSGDKFGSFKTELLNGTFRDRILVGIFDPADLQGNASKEGTLR